MNMTVHHLLPQADNASRPGPTLSALMVYLSVIGNGERIYLEKRLMLPDSNDGYVMSNGKTYYTDYRGHWQEFTGQNTCHCSREDYQSAKAVTTS